jgi:hypothetical protein
MQSPKRPHDPNQLAKNIVDIAIGENSEPTQINTYNIHAVELGRLGGLKGGKARAAKLTKEERTRIAKKAAKARWGKTKKKNN